MSLEDCDDRSAKWSGSRILRQGQEKEVIQQSAIQTASATGSCLYIGQDRFGRWVVRDAECRCGGLFANQTEAIRFAMYECQRRPQSVIMLPDGLELDGAAPLTPAQRFAS